MPVDENSSSSSRARKGRRPSTVHLGRETKRRRTSATDFVRVKSKTGAGKHHLDQEEPVQTSLELPKSLSSDEQEEEFPFLMESESEEEYAFYDTRRLVSQVQNSPREKKAILSKASYSPLKTFSNVDLSTDDKTLNSLIVSSTKRPEIKKRNSKAVTDCEESFEASSPLPDYVVDDDYDGYDPDREIRRIMSLAHMDSPSRNRLSTSPMKKHQPTKKLFDLSSPVKPTSIVRNKIASERKSRESSPESSGSSNQSIRRRLRSPSFPISTNQSKHNSNSSNNSPATSINLNKKQSSANPNPADDISVNSRKRAHTPDIDSVNVIAESPCRNRVKAPIPARAKAELQSALNLGELLNFPFSFTSQQSLPIL